MIDREVRVSRLKLGVCAPIDSILDVERLGYDFLEGNLSEVALMTEPGFRRVYALVGEAGIRVEAMSCMLPRELNVTGRGVDARALHDYLDFSFSRAKRLGVEVLTLASASARQVPEGWPVDLAWRQFSNFLRMLERHAADYDLTIAVEPLCRNECNLLATVSEATLLCSILQLNHIKVLADTYHMAMEHEPLSSLVQAGPLLAHVHTACALGRSFPKAGDGEDYKALFWALDQAGYLGRVSVEAGYDNFEEDAKAAFEVLDAARRTL